MEIEIDYREQPGTNADCLDRCRCAYKETDAEFQLFGPQVL